MYDLFTAVKARYLATDLATSTNGIAVQDELPNVQRPYLIANPVADALVSRTNVGDYHELNFEVHAIADDYETATKLGYQVQDRILRPPLSFAGPNLKTMMVQKGSVRWRKEDQYWRTIVEFSCTAAKPPLSR